MIDKIDPKPRKYNQYTPTPEEIRIACEEIRREWSEDELMRRSTSRKPMPWQVPIVSEPTS